MVAEHRKGPIHGWKMNKLAQLLTSELDAMWHFALRLTANQADAEDLVQRTCLKALEKADEYQERGRIRSWLFQIEHRIWLNVLRARQIRHTGSFKHAPFKHAPFRDGQFGEALSESQKTVELDASATHHELANTHSPESQMRLYQIFEQVESLPEAQRLVVTLVCVEGFTYQETAQVLDIPVGTVMSRLARARITLGEAMLRGNMINASADVDSGTLR